MNNQNQNLRDLARYSVDRIRTMDNTELVALTTEFIRRFIGFLPPELNNATEYVILMGNTGAGKSTINNYLTGNTGRVQIDDLGHAYLTFPEAELSVAPAANAESWTFLPKIKTFGGKAYIDIAGFKDNRGFFVNLCSGILFKEFVSNFANIKVCLVAEYSNITDAKGANLLTFLRTSVIDILPKECWPNVSLIINKVASTLNLDQVRKSISDIKINENQNLQNLVQNLIANNKISIFSQPDVESHPVNSLYVNSAQVGHINHVLAKNTEAIHGNQFENATWPMNQKVLEIIFTAYHLTINLKNPDLLRSYSAHMFNISSDIERQELLKLAKDKKAEIGHLINPRQAENQEINIDTLTDKLNLLNSEHNFVLFKKMIPFLHNNGSIETLQNKVNDALEILNRNIGKYISACSQLRKSSLTSEDGTEKKIIGNFIEFSNKDLKDVGNNIKNVKLFATNYIIIKESITLRGVNLTIVTPHLIVDKPNISINLSGRDADNHESKASVSHGLPGKAGEASGNLSIISTNVHNAGSMTISMYGGRGGNGQNGANGKNGRNGVDGREILKSRYNEMMENAQNASSRDSSSETAPLMQNIDRIPDSLQAQHVILNDVNGPFSILINDPHYNTWKTKTLCCCIPTYKINTINCTIQGTPGEEGERGYLGGAKGQNGANGQMQLVGISGIDSKIISKNPNNEPKDGKIGAPGNGGVNGSDCEVKVQVPHDFYKFGCSVGAVLSLGIIPLIKQILSSSKPDSIAPKLKDKPQGSAKNATNEDNNSLNYLGQEQPAILEVPDINSIMVEYREFVSGQNDLPEEYLLKLTGEFAQLQES